MAADNQLSSNALTATILANRFRPGRTYWRELGRTAHRCKMVAAVDEEKNRLWFIAAFAAGSETYLNAFRQLGRGEYYEGWCTLEQAEIIFASLVDNPFISDFLNLVKQRADLIALWQSTFPYRHFVSPGMILKRWECSICGKQSTPVEPCGHIQKRVYAGQLCYRRITKCEPREVSLVTDPVQKYSVLQLDYDYSVVRYVLEHLNGPFHAWSGEWTHKRHPHENFIDVPLNSLCPCDSSLRYSECCRREVGVKLPHFQMTVFQGPQRGTFDDKIVLRSGNNQASTDDEKRTFRAAVLKAGP